MIGRNWPDTIVAIGKEHSDLGATLERVNAAHRELGMTAIDDQWPDERFYFRSDHYNFARKGVPILFFFNGVHPDYHQVSDSPDKINSEKESRILRLLFYLGQDIANAARAAGLEAGELQGDRGGGGMSETLADFDAFRARMNDVILGGGNLTINRFFALDGPPTRPGPSAPKPRRCSAWSHRWCSAATTASRTMSSGATRKGSPARNSWRSSR